MNLFKLLLVVPVLMCASAFAQPGTEDPCEARLPVTLRAALTKLYPEYHLAQLTDYDKDDIDRHRENSDGNPCLSVASADVDGDGSADFALIVGDQSKHTLLIAARNVARKSWAIDKLMDLNDVIGRTYVDLLEPDSYRDMYATDNGPSDYVAEPGRVRRYKASRPGFIAGTIESTGIAFFYTGKRWVHLWLSD
jgi:hypothetical protein